MLSSGNAHKMHAGKSNKVVCLGDDDKKSTDNETKSLLDTPQENNENQQKTTANDKETWPLDGNAIVDSFKAAGTEHLF